MRPASRNTVRQFNVRPRTASDSILRLIRSNTSSSICRLDPTNICQTISNTENFKRGGGSWRSGYGNRPHIRPSLSRSGKRPVRGSKTFAQILKSFRNRITGNRNISRNICILFKHFIYHIFLHSVSTKINIQSTHSSLGVCKLRIPLLIIQTKSFRHSLSLSCNTYTLSSVMLTFS